MTHPPNGRRRSEASRRATLDAALELCAEQGFAHVTVEGIAARAGVSKKTVYRWWPSKAAVILEAADESGAAAIVFPDTGDLAADLCTQVAGVIGLLTGPRTRSAFIGVLTAAQHDRDLAQQMHQQWFRPRIEEFRQRLRAAQEQGRLPADVDPDLIMDLVYGPLYHRLMAQLPLPDEAYLRRVMDAALPAPDRPGPHTPQDR